MDILYSFTTTCPRPAFTETNVVVTRVIMNTDSGSSCTQYGWCGIPTRFYEETTMSKPKAAVSHRERLIEALCTDPKAKRAYLAATIEDSDPRVHKSALKVAHETALGTRREKTQWSLAQVAEPGGGKRYRGFKLRYVASARRVGIGPPHGASITSAGGRCPPYWCYALSKCHSDRNPFWTTAMMD